MFGKLAWAAVAAAAIGALGFAGPAGAAELLLGAYAHDVAFLGAAIGSGAADREKGADIELGIRSDRIEAWRWIGAPQAHAFVSVNTDGTSDFVAAGLSWPIRLTDRFYLRPGLGLAYTDGKAKLPAVNAPGLTPAEIQRRLTLYQTRIDFGSRLLFEPEIALGAHLGGPWSAELSWVHISNGEIFHHGKNQGLDDAGIRVIYALGARGR
ncbi:MAG: deacylase [Phenylobacterium sp.]|nr:deacylase [Phenylobacterium sp.]